MARPIAPRLEITALKDRSSSDLSQVPADNATIKFYRQGATMSAPATIPDSSDLIPVDVYDSGQVQVGDVVCIGETGDTLDVTAVTPTQVTVRNTTGSDLPLAAGTRLFPLSSPRPVLYADPLAKGAPLGSDLGVDSLTGRVAGYLSENRVDYLMSIPGRPNRLYIDVAGGFGRSDQGWSDLRDFGGSLASALDALPPEGGAVFVPRGVWPVTAGVVIDKPNVTLFGEGYESVLRAATPNAFDLITVRQSFFRMSDLTIDGAGTVYDSSGRSCVVVQGLGASGVLVLSEHFENVRFTGAPRYGLLFQDAITLLARNCQFDSNFGSGVRLEPGTTTDTGTTTTHFVGCSFSRNGDRGCETLSVTALSFLACSFEGNKGGIGQYVGNGLDATKCLQIQVQACLFRNADTPARASNFIGLNTCLATMVDGCTFDGGDVEAKQPTRGVVFNNSAWSRLSNCRGSSLKDALAWFNPESPNCVELGNIEVGEDLSWGMPRFDVQGTQFIGCSRRHLSVPLLAGSADAPIDGTTVGSLSWFDGQLRIWIGGDTLAGWKAVALSP